MSRHQSLKFGTLFYNCLSSLPCTNRQRSADLLSDKTAKHRRDSICAVVGFQSQWLLKCGVPDRHDQNESWIYNGFKTSQQEAVCRDAGKAGACWRGDQDDAPANCRYANDFSYP
jgi:hypothetical protein